jgi:broad specificity phosphatase PhoE
MKPMHFIRHGQSHFNLHMNRTGQDPGINDAGLTELGFEQARQAAQNLIGKGVREIIVSPYSRALQTAHEIAKELEIPMHVEPLAGEMSLYSCDIGTPVSKLRLDWAHLDFAHMPHDNWWPQDESHDDLARRADVFRAKWKERLKNGDFALVSHWYFLNHLTGENFQNGQVVYKCLIF